MIEHKSLRISPAEEVATIELYEAFGWKVEDSREVYSEKSVQIERTVADAAGSTVQYVTNYLTLRFGRDTNMPNYAKLKQYENEYFEEPMRKPVPNGFGSKKVMLIFTVLGILGLILGVVFAMYLPKKVLCLIPFAVMLVAIFVWVLYFLRKSNIAKAHEYNRKVFEEKQLRRIQIINECRAILG